MGSVTDPYGDVVVFYINLVRMDSPLAAAALERIRTTISSKAAMQAALIITVIRMELRQQRLVVDKGLYSDLIQDYPEAAVLVEYAIGCCMNAWGISDYEFEQLNLDDSDINAYIPLD